MKIYRLITLVAAVLITVLTVSFFADAKVGASTDQAHSAVAQVP